MNLFKKFQAAFSRHHDVGKNDVKFLAAQQLHGAVRVVANRGFMPGETKRAR